MKISVRLLIGVVAGAAAAAIAVALPATVEAVRAHPAEAVAAVALTLGLQLVRLRLPRVGSTGFASLGLVVTAVAFGPGPAMVAAVLAGVVHWVRTRGLLHRAVFDAANWALGAGAAAVAYDLLGRLNDTAVGEFAAGAGAGITYVALNHALLCLAMSVSEARSLGAVWRERFGWVPAYLVAFAPVAGCATLGETVLPAGVTVALALSLVLLLLLRRNLRARELAAA